MPSAKSKAEAGASAEILIEWECLSDIVESLNEINLTRLITV